MALRSCIARWTFFLIIFWQLAIIQFSQAQESEYLIYISDIRRDVVHKNWLGIPRSVDCTLYWEVYKQEANSLKPMDSSIFDLYQVRYRKEQESSEGGISTQVNGNFYACKDLQAGIRYHFIVEGIQNGVKLAVSDTAFAVFTGKLKSSSPRPPKWHHWIPFNGRVPMAIIGRGYVFDIATKAGKIAFHFIWNFFVIGSLIVLSCIRDLRLSRIFPIERGIQIGKGYDRIYEQGISSEFRNIIDEWRILVENSNEHMRNKLAKGDQTRLEDIEMENVRFWQKEGTETVRGLSDRLQKLNRYPTARIVQAGLANHELGGFRWLEVSQEVDRSIENRASSELEHLRRKCHLDWLWNLGTLAPLVGLFGTATGISFIFATLTMIHTRITQNDLINRLANGIFEALWTTIFGLFVGIILMICYYYYQNKLNWIYSKWEEIYVQVTEKL